MGYEVLSYNINTSEDILFQTILRTFNINSILDVGANEGQFASKLLNLGYTGHIYSFEPLHAIYSKLHKKTAGYSNWSAINMGVGSKEEELVINVAENFESSSILEVDNKSIEVEPATRTTHQEKIKVTTIDAFIAGHKNLNNEVLLKLDIQGYEMEALKGALENLNRFKLIQVELSFVQVYKGGPLYKEVINFLEEKNYEFFTFIPAFVDSKTGRMLQADGIFVRKT